MATAPTLKVNRAGFESPPLTRVTRRREHGGYSRITVEVYSMCALAHIGARSMQPWTGFVMSSCSMLQT